MSILFLTLFFNINIIIFDFCNNKQIEKNEESLKLLNIYAFDVLNSKLNNKNIDSLSLNSMFKNIKYPLFVTWLKGPNKDLRGCIGTFYPDELETNIKKYSLLAAFEDSRFSPISKNEFSSLHCEISLLTDFESAKDCYDWELGKHGIQIIFVINEREYRATFLPHVALEQKWDKETTLKQLVMKAGYYGKLKEVENKIKLTRYQSKIINLSYDEYISYKNKNNDL